MKQLSPTARSKAITFLKGQARPLEQKLYAYHFEGGALSDVLTELARFQNADGGFGHALEPDIRLPDSSVVATTIAFQRLRELRAPAEHLVVVNGCRYLRDTYDAAGAKWPIIPPHIDDAPHAPWWVYRGELSHSLSNPRAEILGYLYDYADHFPDTLRQPITEAVVNFLLAQPDEMEMHDLLCYVRLYETAGLPDKIKTRLFDKLKRIVERVVTRDPAQWRSYGLPPLSVSATPNSPFTPLFRDALEANLDFVIDQQADEGYWGPNWSWADLWPDAWAQAERDWRSVSTLNTLCILRAFGRLN